jgi:probable addiction module antidote protein
MRHQLICNNTLSETRDSSLYRSESRPVLEAFGAQGGVGTLAKKAHVGRESLYKTLSGTGNPKWHTLVSLCVAMGLNLRLT